jgi:hypothetical protein
VGVAGDQPDVQTEYFPDPVPLAVLPSVAFNETQQIISESGQARTHVEVKCNFSPGHQPREGIDVASW